MIGKSIKKLCCEDISLIENYDLAINDITQIWHCHHRKETDEMISRKELINNDLYYNRPANELIFLTDFDHRSLHATGRIWSDESKEKDRINNIGKKRSIETKENIRQGHLGTKLSIDHKEKIRQGHLGKKFSDKHKENLSKAHLGKRPTKETNEKKRQAMLAYWAKRKQQKNI